MICPICTHTMQHVFNAQVLSKYEASYQSCPECSYLKVENPFWLEEAYGDAIARADTGIVMRNLGVVSKLAGVFYFVLKQRGNDPSLDVAGGYGLLTRLMRDIGFNFYWADVYCKNLIAPGFEYRKELGPCNAVTAIEVMEHLEDPIDFVQTQIASVDAQYFIFTTELFEGSPPAPGSWWYYAFETGQHIGFFQKKTLEAMAKRLNMQFSSSGGIHLFSRTPVNKMMFRIVANKLIAPLIAVLVRVLNGSKTMSDHQMMMREIELGDQ